MKHLGDITKIDGHKVPLVDIITGGSPCQDLSVAGKRAGLDGARSGLFMEQIRIIKEMRDESIKQLRSRGATFDIRYIQPRYMVWENVPGAFSSNKGEDFRAVLEETAKIVCEDAIIPRPERGKWTPSGCIMGDGWSIAWRVHDAQFWGVPQRRKRIALVADFGGDTAPKILFEFKGLSGDSEASREEGQGAAGTIRTNIKSPSLCLNGWDVQSKHIQPENGIAEALYAGECRYGGGESYVAQTISFQERAGSHEEANEYSYNMSENDPCQQSTAKVYCLQGNGIDRADTAGCNGKGWREDQCYTLNTIDRPAVCKTYQQTTGALTPGAHPGSYNGQDAYNDMLVVDKSPQTVTYGVDCYNQTQSKEISKALNAVATDSDHIPCVYGLDRASFNQGQNAQYDFSIEEETAQTLISRGPGGVLSRQSVSYAQEITKE